MGVSHHVAAAAAVGALLLDPPRLPPQVLVCLSPSTSSRAGVSLPVYLLKCWCVPPRLPPQVLVCRQRCNGRVPACVRFACRFALPLPCLLDCCSVGASGCRLRPPPRRADSVGHRALRFVSRRRGGGRVACAQVLDRIRGADTERVSRECEEGRRGWRERVAGRVTRELLERARLLERAGGREGEKEGRGGANGGAGPREEGRG